MPNDDDISTGALNALNKHGHSFQQAMIRRLDTILRFHRLPYRFVVGEYPVRVGAKSTSIDFILTGDLTHHQIIVAECKRSDPALSHWVFTKTPYTRDGDSGTYAYVSGVHTSDGVKVYERTGRVAGVEPHHIHFELKTNKKGDGQGNSRNAIELALNQVFLGTAGLLEALKSDHALLLQTNAVALVLPVVFTTARLFVVQTDIATADLSSGDLEAVKTREVSSVWFQANLSRELRANLDWSFDQPEARGLARTIIHRHTRAALIISASTDGLNEFVQRGLDLDVQWL